MNQIEIKKYTTNAFSQYYFLVAILFVMVISIIDPPVEIWRFVLGTIILLSLAIYI